MIMQLLVFAQETLTFLFHKQHSPCLLANCSWNGGVFKNSDTVCWVNNNNKNVGSNVQGKITLNSSKIESSKKNYICN